MSSGRYLKGPTKPRIPGVVFTVVCDTIDRVQRGDEDIVEHRLRQIVASVTYRRGSKWSTPIVTTHDTGDSLLPWMRERAIQGRVNWVITPIATDTLTLIEFWRYCDECGATWEPWGIHGRRRRRGNQASGGVVFRSIVPWGRNNIYAYEQEGTSWRWVSATNYWPEGNPSDRGRAGSRGVTASAGRNGRRQTLPTAATQVEGISEDFRGLCTWWGSVAKSPFGSTIGQLSIGMLRTYTPKHALSSHGHTLTHKLERDAAHNGRATTWYVGRVRTSGIRVPSKHVRYLADAKATEEGPAYHVDVTSMHGWLLSTHEFPTIRTGYREEVDTKCIAPLARSMGVIATVTVRTRCTEYPVKGRYGTTYPMGQYTTTLAGPELLKISEEGDILRCHRIATYQLGRCFAPTASALLAMREDARRAGNGSYVQLCKGIVNTLGGRLAQRKGRWVRCSEMDGLHQWGERAVLSVRSGQTSWYRFISGICFRLDKESDPSGPFTAAFCYLTAYCRLHMRELRERLSSRVCISQDTDGIWVLRRGIAELGIHEGSNDSKPGHVRISGKSDYSRHWGPRHYLTEKGWVLSGYCNPVVSLDGRTITDDHTSSPVGLGDAAPPQRTYTLIRETRFPLDISGQSVGIDGWTLPLYAAPKAC